MAACARAGEWAQALELLRRLTGLPAAALSRQLDGGREVADCETEAEEQAVCLIDDDTGSVTVVQPNEDGSYWRKIVRNKIVRMKEKRREAAAKRFIEKNYKVTVDDKIDIQSSWGPYMSTSGTAKKTTVPGVTSKEKLKL